jgi:hypothetical protein
MDGGQLEENRMATISDQYGFKTNEARAPRIAKNKSWRQFKRNAKRQRRAKEQALLRKVDDFGSQIAFFCE